MRWSH